LIHRPVAGPGKIFSTDVQGCSSARYVIAVTSPSSGGVGRRTMTGMVRALNPRQPGYPRMSGRLTAQPRVSLFANTLATATWQDRNRTDQPS
jgi:hypothetical protein